MQKLVALNENGRRIGEHHPRAKLLDAEVDQVLVLLEAGLSYAAVALKFDVSKSCIQHIANGSRRGQMPRRVVKVSDTPRPAVLKKERQSPRLLACGSLKHAVLPLDYPEADMVRVGPTRWLCQSCAVGLAATFKKHERQQKTSSAPKKLNADQVGYLVKLVSRGG